MPALLILLFEVMTFSALAEKFGFLNTLGAYWVPTFILMVFTPFALTRLRQAQGQDSFSGLNQLLVLVGFFLCMIPLVLTRLVGLLFVLPGLRHLLIWKFKSAVQKKTHQYFHQFGNGFRFYYQGSGPTFEDAPSGMKDVTPIQPERIETKNSDFNT